MCILVGCSPSQKGDWLSCVAFPMHLESIRKLCRRWKGIDQLLFLSRSLWFLFIPYCKSRYQIFLPKKCFFPCAFFSLPHLRLVLLLSSPLFSIHGPRLHTYVTIATSGFCLFVFLIIPHKRKSLCSFKAKRVNRPCSHFRERLRPNSFYLLI